ncbi:flagellar basal-body MS-ring/collar protein FliF [uncultured Cohaesibacter sp.]|uniref:flagellar basal-body MS-ring/collar protein FliF n=1 Tax=uncultured Cohaesibacter sp. TaxID=1002546 RepID=UPI0029C8CB01|nr:flagellar basal-body MS-ring/collar protein FliF [uncultured Cohaesibacter sp.]
MNGILDFLKTLGPTRLAAMGVVTAALIGFFAFIMLRVTEPTLAPLYTDLSFEDSIQITKLLEAQNVTHELRDEGAVILAPKSDILRLRMQLAESGLPSGGNVGYEIFDKSETLGTTSFVQNVNHLRALEGELSRSIRTIRNVRQARVHLVLPQRQLFKRDQKPPSASIAVKLQGSLNPTQIQSIQHLVASAVEGLDPENVTIIDGNGRLLASGRGSDESYLSSRMDERRMEMENRLRDQVDEIVTSIVGQGRTRIEVTAEMDFNKVTETSDTFDPDGQVVRSTQTRSEAAASQESENTDGVTVGNELPNADEANNDPAGRKENSNTTEELINYEISRVTKTEVVQGGRVKRLSVAVLVDGVYEKDANGDLTYQPRSADELEQIATLVRSAVGFDQTRGDKIEVINLQFAEGPETIFDDSGMELLAFTKDDYVRFAELGILLIMTLLVLLMVVRPLMKRMFEKPEEHKDGEHIVVGVDGVPMIVGENGELVPAADKNRDIDHPTMRAIENAQLQGALQADTLLKVGEMVKENPEEAAKIIRLWLQDAA